jgi:hypothetical protein
MITSASVSALLFIGFLVAWVLYAMTRNEAWITVGVWGQLLAGGTAGYSLWAYSYVSVNRRKDAVWRGEFDR